MFLRKAKGMYINMKKTFLFTFLLFTTGLLPNGIFFIFNNRESFIYNFITLLYQILVTLVFSLAIFTEICNKLQIYIYKYSYVLSYNISPIHIYNKITKISLILFCSLWQIILIFGKNNNTSSIYILSSTVLLISMCLIAIRPDSVYISKTNIFFSKFNFNFMYVDIISISIKEDNLKKIYQLTINQSEKEFRYKTNKDTLDKIIIKIKSYSNVNIIQ